MTPGAGYLTILRQREVRAQGRSQAMEAIQHLLQSLFLRSSKQDILRIVGRAWKYSPTSS